MDEKVVKIEKLVFGGKGLSRDLDRVTFVPLTLPGETVRIRVTKQHRDYQEAEAIEIIEPHPARVAPQCAYFGHCGGCQLSHASYEQQIRLKEQILRETLERNQVSHGEIEIIPGNPWGYRQRAQLKYDSANKKLGFYELDSNRVVDVQECLCLSPTLNERLKSLRVEVCSKNIPRLREIELFENDRQQTAVFPLPAVPEVAGDTAEGLTISFRKHRFPMNPNIFLQVNPGMWRAMIQEVESHFPSSQYQTLLELYCGAGFFTAPLASIFQRVIACEENADAIRYAKTHHSLKNVEWICSKVENFRFPSGVDAILVDPPRAGLHQNAVRQILQMKPQSVTYVSCDCPTFARDLKKMKETYSLEKLTLLDLFPQTYHFEMIALLKRR